MIKERRSVLSNQSHQAGITPIDRNLSAGLETGDWTRANSYVELNNVNQSSLKGSLEGQS